jgi:hypothetical protein
MNEDQARQRLADVFAKHVQSHLPSAQLGEPDLLNESPMDLEAEVDGAGVILSVIERSPDDTTDCRSISARQPESVSVGDFYVLITVDPEDVGYEKAIALTAGVSESGIFFRLMDDNIEMEPTEFAETLREHQEDEE